MSNFWEGNGRKWRNFTLSRHLKVLKELAHVYLFYKYFNKIIKIKYYNIILILILILIKNNSMKYKLNIIGTEKKIFHL